MEGGGERSGRKSDYFKVFKRMGGEWKKRSGEEWVEAGNE